MKDLKQSLQFWRRENIKRQIEVPIRADLNDTIPRIGDDYSR